MTKIFETNSLPPFDPDKPYDDFLIGQYETEEVKREEEQIQKSFNETNDDTKLMALFCLFLDCVAAR